MCDFAPKKLSGPLSRRCIHCGRHKTEHGSEESRVHTEQPAQGHDWEGRNNTHDEGELPTAQPQVFRDNRTGLHIEAIDNECYLLRNFLSIEEQIALIQFIHEMTRPPSDRPKAMVSGPKTLILGEDQPNLCFDTDQEPSIVSCMIDRATDVLKRNDANFATDLREYKRLSTAVIDYESPNGSFPPHIDHCQNSFVYLVSLGCAANFMVKGPTMHHPYRFQFLSGDILIFNASTEAAILHGVLSIDHETSCPRNLAGRFQNLRNHRYGVQTRSYFSCE